jgi:hypothetical protein
MANVLRAQRRNAARPARTRSTLVPPVLPDTPRLFWVGLLPPAKGNNPHSSLDLILGLAAALAVVGLGVNTVRQMPDQQAKTLRDGLIGSAAGLLVGYGVGRFRP